MTGHRQTHQSLSSTHRHWDEPAKLISLTPLLPTRNTAGAPTYKWALYNLHEIGLMIDSRYRSALPCSGLARATLYGEPEARDNKHQN